MVFVLNKGTIYPYKRAIYPYKGTDSSLKKNPAVLKKIPAVLEEKLISRLNCGAIFKYMLIRNSHIFKIYKLHQHRKKKKRRRAPNLAKTVLGYRIDLVTRTIIQILNTNHNYSNLGVKAEKEKENEILK